MARKPKAKPQPIAQQASPARNVPEAAAGPGATGKLRLHGTTADVSHDAIAHASGSISTSAGLISGGLDSAGHTYPPQGPEGAASGGFTQGQSVGVPLANSTSLRTDAAVDPLGTAIINNDESAGGEPAAEPPGGTAKPQATEGKEVAESVPVFPVPNIHIPIGPMAILLPYQAKWALDGSRWKCGLQARQTGKDFASGAEGIAHCFQAQLRKEKADWFITAPSERQALESLNKWKEWAEAFELAIDEIEEEPIKDVVDLKSTTITFASGSRVMAIPGKPETTRGLSGNILFTEFAFFENPDATWKAALPTITNPLRGGPKKVRIISTPNGQGNKFHDIWTKNRGVAGARWSTHLVTILDAVDQGLPIDIQELMDGLDDPEAWDQEFLCKFIDQASVLLSYDLIIRAQNPLAMISSPLEWFETTRTPYYLGIDFGRKKNLTVSWALETPAPGYRLTKDVLCLQNTPTPDQVDVLRPRIKRCVRACLDYTGPGIGLGDYLVKEFGEWKPSEDKYGKIELCTFGNLLKNEVMAKMRMAFEKPDVGVPNDRAIREDLHSLYRVATATGGVRYTAPNNADGHADRASALALALRATEFGDGGSGRIITFTGGRTARVLATRRERSLIG